MNHAGLTDIERVCGAWCDMLAVEGRGGDCLLREWFRVLSVCCPCVVRRPNCLDALLGKLSHHR